MLLPRSSFHMPPASICSLVEVIQGYPAAAAGYIAKHSVDLAIAAMSYAADVLNDPESDVRVHPLGFARILIAHERSFGVRLHLWHRVLIPSTSANKIHSHSFRSTSLIVLGSLAHANYNVIEHINGKFKLVRTSHGEGRSTRYEPCDAISYSCSETGVDVVSTGEMKVLDPGCFHSVEVPGDMAMTLFVETSLDDVVPNVGFLVPDRFSEWSGDKKYAVMAFESKQLLRVAFLGSGRSLIEGTCDEAESENER